MPFRVRTSTRHNNTNSMAAVKALNGVRECVCVFCTLLGHDGFVETRHTKVECLKKKTERESWIEKSQEEWQIIKFYMLSSSFLFPFLLQRKKKLAHLFGGCWQRFTSWRDKKKQIDIDATKSNIHTSSSFHSAGIKQMENTHCETATRKDTDEKRITKTFVCFRESLFYIPFCFGVHKGALIRFLQYFFFQSPEYDRKFYGTFFNIYVHRKV